MRHDEIFYKEILKSARNEVDKAALSEAEHQAFVAEIDAAADVKAADKLTDIRKRIVSASPNFSEEMKLQLHQFMDFQLNTYTQTKNTNTQTKRNVARELNTPTFFPSRTTSNTYSDDNKSDDDKKEMRHKLLLLVGLGLVGAAINIIATPSTAMIITTLALSALMIAGAVLFAAMSGLIEPETFGCPLIAC